MTALRLVGSGRQPLAAETERTAVEEFAAHNREAIAFVEDCRAYLHILGKVCLTLSARHYQVVRELRRRMDAYEARHQLPDDEPVERAA